MSADEFVIEDNCGGIKISVAEHYAFRFGRTDKAQKVLDFDHATGQFGVGMKRAIFKMGSGFRIRSSSSEGVFTMDESVTSWVDREEEDWGFDLTIAATEPEPHDQRGTKITVAPLHDTVQEDFGLRDFQNTLNSELVKRYVVPLQQGLSIKLNRNVVHARSPKVLASAYLAPTVRVIQMDAAGRDVENGQAGEIKLRLLCGLARIEAPDAGWSVALNSRMVLVADQTAASGWGARNGTRVPAFHNQYGRLRGLVLLDCDATRKLPWNTTKTRLDVDQAVYRRVRREMILAMEPVIKFLNRVKDEVDAAKKAGEDADSRPLHLLIDEAEEISAIDLVLAEDAHEFAPPASQSQKAARSSTTSIQYEMDRERVRLAKRELGARSNARVGEATFEFWWSATFD